MSFIRGCYDSGPQIFFDETDRDFRRRFWTFSKNFGFPELEANLFRGVYGLLLSDREKAELLKHFLRGEKITLRDNHVLCRVEKYFVGCISRAKDLVRKVFDKAYSGQGFFRDFFLNVNYEIDPGSLKVDLFDMADAPDCYADKMPVQVPGTLDSYMGVMDISYDAKIQLRNKFSGPALDKGNPSFVYMNDSAMVYSAVLALLENPGRVWIDSLHNTCHLLPETEAENDRFFLNKLFFELPLNIYGIAFLLRSFSNRRDVRECLSNLFPFQSMKRKKDSFVYERGCIPTSGGAFANLFMNRIEITFAGEASRLMVWETLNIMLAFLSENIRQARQVLENPGLSIPRNWESEFVRRHGLNEIRILFADVSSDLLNSAGMTTNQVRNCLKEFLEILENTERVLDNMKRAVLMSVNENVREDIGYMVVNAVKMNPLDYSEHFCPAVRSFAQEQLNGEFFAG